LCRKKFIGNDIYKRGYRLRLNSFESGFRFDCPTLRSLGAGSVFPSAGGENSSSLMPVPNTFGEWVTDVQPTPDASGSGAVGLHSSGNSERRSGLRQAHRNFSAAAGVLFFNITHFNLLVF